MIDMKLNRKIKMKRQWALRELTDTPYPDFSFETVNLRMAFCYPNYLERAFKVLSVTRDPIPIMGFDEWW